jgi:hypothetical protein
MHLWAEKCHFLHEKNDFVSAVSDVEFHGESISVLEMKKFPVEKKLRANGQLGCVTIVHSRQGGFFLVSVVTFP